MREEKIENVQKLFAMRMTREGLTSNGWGYSKEEKQLDRKHQDISKC